MKHEPKHSLPKALRYPLFMVALLILLVGEYSAQQVDAGNEVRAAVAVLGMIFMVLSVALR